MATATTDRDLESGETYNAGKPNTPSASARGIAFFKSKIGLAAAGITVLLIVLVLFSDRYNRFVTAPPVVSCALN